MSNRTILQIPSTVPVEIRRVFSRVIEQIDIILGTGDRSPYATQEDVAVNTDDITDLNSVVDILTGNPIQEKVELLDYTVVTRGAGYVQAEAQAIADDVKDNADKIDELINSLKLANILR